MKEKPLPIPLKVNGSTIHSKTSSTEQWIHSGDSTSTAVYSRSLGIKKQHGHNMAIEVDVEVLFRFGV